MRIEVTNISATRLFIGFTGENNHLHIAFDCGAVFAEYPDAYGQMAVKPPAGEIYPKALTREGSTLVWDVTASDCANVGDGEYQITFTQGTTVVKSFIGFYTVRESLTAEGEPPEPVEDWLTQVEQALAAFDGLTASAETLPEGSSATATVEMVNGHKNVLFGIPTGATGAQGEQGEQGVPGTDGFSPVVDVTPITGGNRVSITDATGTESFDVMDGADGQDGAPGAPGTDGVSPTVAVAPITGGHEVTITDKDGEHTFDVMNGEKGDPGTPGDPTTLIDDTTTTATNKTWSASKISGDLSQLNSALNDKLDSPETAGTSGQVLTSDGDGGQSWQTPATPTIPVTDVQVNGTSILNQGVANVPFAGGSRLGVIMTGTGNGIYVNSSSGEAFVSHATDDQVKAGSGNYRPIAPTNQHAAAFYGLAKAAGADMASVSGAVVGTYPEAQKVAIQKMLGIYEPPFTLLNNITLEEESSIDLTADSNGTPYNLRSAIIFIFYAENLQSVNNGYSRIRAYNANNNYVNTETGKYTTSTSKAWKLVYFQRTSNMLRASYIRQTQSSMHGTWLSKTPADSVFFDFGNIVKITQPSGDVEPAGTEIKIYGQWAY